jgi:hypothetical protein
MASDLINEQVQDWRNRAALGQLSIDEMKIAIEAIRKVYFVQSNISAINRLGKYDNPAYTISAEVKEPKKEGDRIKRQKYPITISVHGDSRDLTVAEFISLELEHANWERLKGDSDGKLGDFLSSAKPSKAATEVSDLAEILGKAGNEVYTTKDRAALSEELKRRLAKDKGYQQQLRELFEELKQVLAA